MVAFKTDNYVEALVKLNELAIETNTEIKPVKKLRNGFYLVGMQETQPIVKYVIDGNVELDFRDAEKLEKDFKFKIFEK